MALPFNNSEVYTLIFNAREARFFVTYFRKIKLVMSQEAALKKTMPAASLWINVTLVTT